MRRRRASLMPNAIDARLCNYTRIENAAEAATTGTTEATGIAAASSSGAADEPKMGSRSWGSFSSSNSHSSSNYSGVLRYREPGSKPATSEIYGHV